MSKLTLHETPQTLQNYINDNITFSNGHWIWTGKTKMTSNGMIKGYALVGGRTVMASRLAWVAFRGELEAKIHVRNCCGTDLCVNPFDHHHELPSERVAKLLATQAAFAASTVVTNTTNTVTFSTNSVNEYVSIPITSDANETYYHWELEGSQEWLSVPDTVKVIEEPKVDSDSECTCIEDKTIHQPSPYCPVHGIDELQIKGYGSPAPKMVTTSHGSSGDKIHDYIRDEWAQWEE